MNRDLRIVSLFHPFFLIIMGVERLPGFDSYASGSPTPRRECRISKEGRNGVREECGVGNSEYGNAEEGEEEGTLRLSPDFFEVRRED